MSNIGNTGDDNIYNRNRHSVYCLRYHLVVVTKYRHPVIDGRIRERLLEITGETFRKWKCNVISSSDRWKNQGTAAGDNRRDLQEMEMQCHQRRKLSGSSACIFLRTATGAAFRPGQQLQDRECEAYKEGIRIGARALLLEAFLLVTVLLPVYCIGDRRQDHTELYRKPEQG